MLALLRDTEECRDQTWIWIWLWREKPTESRIDPCEYPSAVGKEAGMWSCNPVTGSRSGKWVATWVGEGVSHKSTHKSKIQEIPWFGATCGAARWRRR